MARQRVGAWAITRRQPVVNMTPVVGCSVARIDAERLHRVDRAQSLFDLRPPMDAEQNLAARGYKGQRRIGLSRTDSPNNLDL